MSGMVNLAIVTVAVHALWLLFVIFGAIWTRRRLAWTTLHVLALMWGIVVELGPWPCPLTMAEEYFEAHGGAVACERSATLRFLDAMVYPTLPTALVVTIAVAICVFNLGVYGWRLKRFLTDRRRPDRAPISADLGKKRMRQR